MRVLPDGPEAPDRPQQLVLREHARGLGRQRAHAARTPSATARPARPADAPPAPAASTSSAPTRSRPGRRRTSARRSSACDARAQLGVAERLADVVVAPALEARRPIELTRAPADHDQRHRGVDAAGDAVGGAHAAHEVEARAVGQAEVDEGDVGELRLQQTQTLAGAVGDQQLVAVGGQVVGQERARRRVVLDDEDGGGGIGRCSWAPRSTARPRVLGARAQLQHHIQHERPGRDRP